MSTVSCHKCQRMVDKSACYQCVDKDQTYFECGWDGEAECVRITEENRKNADDLVEATRRSKFLADYGFGMDNLVKIGVLFRDATCYYRRGDVDELEIYSGFMGGGGDIKKVADDHYVYRRLRAYDAS